MDEGGGGGVGTSSYISFMIKEECASPKRIQVFRILEYSKIPLLNYL